MELLFLEPIFKERIWGGTKLHSDFGYNIPSQHTGECWAISAHKNGETCIKNGEFANLPLSFVWKENPELFANNKVRAFPLLIKILDAQTDLSVQVHPDDAYAKRIENELGKAECWYVLDAAPSAQIIYGHSANTLAEFKQRVLNNEWTELLCKVSVVKGDFFNVPTGTVHALGAGILILEVQQSSDTTYRLYDYNRHDDSGNLRELHLKKSFDVINIPHKGINEELIVRKLSDVANLTILTDNIYFKVEKLDVTGGIKFIVEAKYLLVNVIEGNATINGYKVHKGDNFIVPHNVRELNINGTISLIISSEAI